MRTLLFCFGIVAIFVAILAALIAANVVVLTPEMMEISEAVRRTIGMWAKAVYLFLANPAVATVFGILFGVAGILKLEFGRRPHAQPKSSAEPVDKPAPSPINRAESIRIYFDALEERLAADTLSAQYVSLDYDKSSRAPEMVQSFELRQRNSRTAVDIYSAHDKYRTYVLLGEPGSGKSTCLKHLALRQMQEHRNGKSRLIPVFINLAEWREKRMGALDFLESQVRQQVSAGNYLVREFDDLLARGELLLLLDGLNEIPGRTSAVNLAEPDTEKREGFRSNLVSRNSARNLDSREDALRQLATTHAVASKFVVSCRSHEFAGSIEWQRIHILPMTDEQIRIFIDRYVQNDMRTVLTDYLFPEGDPLALGLARNPFYLSQLTLLVKQNKLVKVTNRGQFLNLLLDALLEREDSSAKEARHFVKAASRAAYHMVLTDHIGSRHPVGRWLNGTDRRLGLGIGFLFESDGDVFWRHQLMQEFMAARALAKKPAWTLSSLIREEKWSEIIILYHDVAPNSSVALKRILRLLSKRNGLCVHPSHNGRTLCLMLLLIVGYGFVAANFFVDAFTKGFWWRLAAEHPWTIVLFFLGLPLAHFLIPMFSYNRLAIGNAAYVLSRVATNETRDHIVEELLLTFPRMGLLRAKISQPLADIGPPAAKTLAQALSSRRTAIVKGALDALGKIGDPRSLDAVRSVFARGDFRLYQACYECLAQFKNDAAKEAIASTLPTIQTTADIGPPALRVSLWSTHMVAAFRDQSTPSPELAARLLSAAQEAPNPVAKHLAYVCAAAHGHESALEELGRAARDPEDPMQHVAIVVLAFVRSEKVVDILNDLIITIDYESDEKVREVAITTLSNLTFEGATPKLIELLGSGSLPVQDAALTSLSYLATPEHVSEIMQHYEKLRYSRSELALCLGRVGGDDAIDGLLQIANDRQTSSAIRNQALEILDAQFPNQCVKDFLQLLRNQDFPERSKLLILLSNRPPIGSEFSDLLAKLVRSDPNSEIRQEARRVQRHMNRNLGQRLKRLGVSFASKRFWAIKPWFRQRLGIDDWNRIRNEIELSDIGHDRALHNSAVRQMQVHQQAMAQAKSDPDVWRKVRGYMWLHVMIFVLFVTSVGAIPVLIYRPLAGLGHLAWANWPYALCLLGLSALAYLFKLDDRKSWYLRVINKTTFAATLLLVLGAAFAFIPWLIGEMFFLMRDACLYLATAAAGNPLFAIGALIAAGVLSVALSRGPGVLRGVSKLLGVLSVLAVGAVVLGFALDFWALTMAILTIMMVFWVFLLKRHAGQKRRIRQQHLRQQLELHLGGETQG